MCPQEPRPWLPAQGELYVAVGVSQGCGDVGQSHPVTKRPCTPTALSQDLASEQLLIQMRSGITKGFVFQEAY